MISTKKLSPNPIAIHIGSCKQKQVCAVIRLEPQFLVDTSAREVPVVSRRRPHRRLQSIIFVRDIKLGIGNNVSAFTKPNIPSAIRKRSAIVGLVFWFGTH